MTQRSASHKALVGPAGEHYVMYQAHMRGMLASLAPRNFPEADLVIVGADGATSALVQVKTRTSGRDGGWHMKEKHEQLVLPRLFYCFVNLEPAVPALYVVPSGRVAEVVRESHRAWLGQPPKRGNQPHKDNPMRRILPAYGFSVLCATPGWLSEWQDRWDLLQEQLGR